MDAHCPYGAPAPFSGRYGSKVRSSGSDARLAEMSKLGFHKDLRLVSFGSLKVFGIGILMIP